MNLYKQHFKRRVNSKMWLRLQIYDKKSILQQRNEKKIRDSSISYVSRLLSELYNQGEIDLVTPPQVMKRVYKRRKK